MNPDLSFAKSCVCAALIFLIIVSFYLIHQKDGFLYDDHPLIVAQPELESLDDAISVFKERYYPNLPYYRPLVRMTLLMQKTVHGDNPRLFYMFNVMLMGMIGVALFIFFSSAPFCFKRVLSFGVTLLIIFHPVASSCVYMISDRETLLPALFIICALTSYIGDSLMRYAAAVLFFTCALFSRESSVVLVFVFMAMDYFLKRFGDQPAGPALVRQACRYAAFVPIYAGYFFMRYRLFGGAEFEWNISLKQPAMSLLYTVQTILFPFVELKYEPTLSTWFSPPRVIGTFAFILFVVALSFPVFREMRRWLFMLGAMFILFTLPTLNLLKQETLFAERYVFLPLIPFLTYVVILMRRYGGSSLARRLGPLALITVTLFFAWISMGREAYFRGDLPFFSQWVKTAPDRVCALNGYANSIQAQGEYGQAEKLYLKAIALDPAFEVPYYNLGLLYMKNDRPEEALLKFRQTLAINPRFEGAWYHLGVAYELTSRYTSAADCYRRELSLHPKHRHAPDALDRALTRQEGLPVIEN